MTKVWNEVCDLVHPKMSEEANHQVYIPAWRQISGEVRRTVTEAVLHQVDDDLYEGDLLNE